MPMQCYVNVQSQFGGKNACSSIEKFPSVVQPGNTRTVAAPYYLTSSLLSVVVVAYGRLKTKENFKLLALKEVAVAWER